MLSSPKHRGKVGQNIEENCPPQKKKSKEKPKPTKKVQGKVQTKKQVQGKAHGKAQAKRKVQEKVQKFSKKSKPKNKPKKKSKAKTNVQAKIQGQNKTKLGKLLGGSSHVVRLHKHIDRCCPLRIITNHILTTDKLRWSSKWCPLFWQGNLWLPHQLYPPWARLERALCVLFVN